MTRMGRAEGTLSAPAQRNVTVSRANGRKDTTSRLLHAQELPCPRCGSFARHRIEQGTGPHGNKLCCIVCRVFIRWLPKRSAEERTAQAAHYQREYMATQPPTPDQLRYLKKLAYKGSRPADRLKAHDLIDKMLKAREGVR